MFDLVLSPLKVSNEVEIVERKGTGHPDSICDALAETLSRNLCLEYMRRYGVILHHNVDKALLCGGLAEPAFDGGRVVAPIKIILAGRDVQRNRKRSSSNRRDCSPCANYQNNVVQAMSETIFSAPAAAGNDAAMQAAAE